ncbi:MAG: hypothetical protein WED00_12235, partial [Aquisalimonadaceae bacterium]
SRTRRKYIHVGSTAAYQPPTVREGDPGPTRACQGENRKRLDSTRRRAEKRSAFRRMKASEKPAG